MKKVSVLFFLVTLCIASMAIGCAEIKDNSFSLNATAGTNISTTLSFSGSTGTATATLTLQAGRSASTTMYVQKRVGDSWSKVKSTTGSTKLSTTFTANSGATYRIYVVSNITNTKTGNVEIVKRYSSSKTN